MLHCEELYRAIDADDIDWIDRLLTITPDWINSTDTAPPPLHWAIYRDKRRAVGVLLNHGADLALRDRDRDATPLDYAVVYARRELIPLLISHGASLDSGMQVAIKGASGGFEDYPELPDRRQYEGILELLREMSSPQPRAVRRAPPRQAAAMVRGRLRGGCSSR